MTNLKKALKKAKFNIHKWKERYTIAYENAQEWHKIANANQEKHDKLQYIVSLNEETIKEWARKCEYWKQAHTEMDVAYRKEAAIAEHWHEEYDKKTAELAQSKESYDNLSKSYDKLVEANDSYFDKLKLSEGMVEVMFELMLEKSILEGHFKREDKGDIFNEYKTLAGQLINNQE
jgi:chromosome segregation ATPase